MIVYAMKEKNYSSNSANKYEQYNFERNFIKMNKRKTKFLKVLNRFFVHSLYHQCDLYAAVYLI